MAEVIGSLHIMARTIFGPEIDVDVVGIHLEHDRLQHTFLFDTRIVLRAPCYQVLAVGSRKAGRIVVDGEEQSPRPVLSLDDIG